MKNNLYLAESSRLLLIGAVTVVALGVTACAASSALPISKQDGRLAPCPGTPNCVSTQSEPADEVHWILPLTYTGSLSEARSRVLAVVNDMPRQQIVVSEDDYLHIEFRSRVFRFVDDVEFLFDDDEKVIHFRSAARLGKSDLGVNRKRMEAIRRAFIEQS